MDRRNLLKGLGLLGAASLLPLPKTRAAIGKLKAQSLGLDGNCVLIPTETAGPFPLDLTANTTYFRQDIREDRTGVPFTLRMKIIGLNDCLPMQNVRVNIWHCDKGGSYSGYSSAAGNTTDTVGQTWLRGYQITDANGEVEFTTIFPGWYNGRICHIHFQVYVSSSYSAISQLSFDIDTKNAIYAANSSLYTNGADPMTFASDNIFSDGYAYQLASLTPSSSNGGYESYLEVTVQGTGATTGLGNEEKENAKNFKLGQNFPNPYINETNIPINLVYPADVSIDLLDLNGRKVATVVKNNLSAGEQIIPLNMQQLGIASANYACRIQVKNNKGTYYDYLLLTALH